MFSNRKRRLLLAVTLLAAIQAIAAASERCDIIYDNGLGEEILAIRTKYATPYGEPRFDSSRVDIRPEGRYRIGVQGATLPEAMIIDFPTKSFVFLDLSGLNPRSRMHFVVLHENGRPLLRSRDGDDGEAEGVQVDYLTPENLPCAVDKDTLLNADSFDEMEEAIKARFEEVRDELGELTHFKVEAGPIWNREHARERCPEVTREWSEEHGREARWTGHWRTVVPGKMSECDCVAGTTDVDDTATVEDEGWGETAYFPVFWSEWHGVGIVSENDSDSGEGVSFTLRFRLPETDAAAMLDELFEDLRIDGFRPLRFALKAADKPDDDEVSVTETDIEFLDEEDDKWDAHDRIVEALAAAFAGTDLSGSLIWVNDEIFEKVKAGEEAAASRIVICNFTKKSFEAAFMPDWGVTHR